MPWFKVDDGFYDHPKVEGLSMAARGLWVTAGTWCAKHNTYGRITKTAVKRFGGTPKQISALLRAGLWEEAADGYQFHQWRKHQDGDYRKNIAPRVREAVMERDNYQCVFCGASDDLSLDHIIPYRENGPDTVENLRVLCMPCNNRRYQEERRG